MTTQPMVPVSRRVKETVRMPQCSCCGVVLQDGHAQAFLRVWEEGRLRFVSLCQRCGS